MLEEILRLVSEFSLELPIAEVISIQILVLSQLFGFNDDAMF